MWTCVFHFTFDALGGALFGFSSLISPSSKLVFTTYQWKKVKSEKIVELSFHLPDVCLECGFD